MNWEAIQAIAELAAAGAVLLSLGYIAIQVRQNTASVQAGTVARSSELLNQLHSTVWTDPESAQIYQLALSGDEITDPSLAVRVRMFWASISRDFEAIYYQHQAGQLPDAIWEGWLSEMMLLFCTPGGSDAVAVFKSSFLSSDFGDFLETQVKSQAEPPLLVLRARWDEAAKSRRTGDG